MDGVLARTTLTHGNCGGVWHVDGGNAAGRQKRGRGGRRRGGRGGRAGNVGKKGRKKGKRGKMGSYEQEIQFDKDQTSGAGLSSQQTFTHISLLLIDTLQIHQKFVLTRNIRGILELHDATIYLSTMHDSCNSYGT